MSTTYRIGKDRTVVKRGDKVHINDSSEDIQNYYLIECNVDGVCLCIRVKDETKPFNNSESYNEGDYKTFDDTELEEGWVEGEYPEEDYESYEEFRAEMNRVEKQRRNEQQEFQERMRELRMEEARRLEEARRQEARRQEEARREEEVRRQQAAASAAGAGAGTGSVPKYRIGSEEIEQGGKVHNKYTLKNFYLLKCQQGLINIICRVQPENRRKEPFWIVHDELLPGWITQEQKAALKEAKRQHEEAKRIARIQKANYIIENYKSVPFQDILNFPKNTIFYYKSGDRTIGLYLRYTDYDTRLFQDESGYFYKSVANIYVFDVDTQEGGEARYLFENLPKINISLHTEAPHLKGQEQSSSSSSSSAAGAGAGPGAQVSETPAQKERRECLEFLATQGIKEYKDFKDWVLKGHPNKGGDAEIFKKVSACMDKTLKKDKENKKNKESKGKSQQGGVTKKRKYRKYAKKRKSVKTRKQ